MLAAAIQFEPGSMERLQQVMEARQRLLGESAMESVAYGAARLVTALRASTKVSKERRTAVPYQRPHGAAMATQYHMNKGELKQIWGVQVWRQGADQPEVRVPQIWHWVGKLPPQQAGESKSQFYARCRAQGLESMRPAITRSEAEGSRMARISRRGLAKAAWSMAYEEIQHRTGAAGDRTAAVARENVDVVAETSTENMSITIFNRLGYATAAFKSGKLDVALAAKRAANGMTAVLMKRMTGDARPGVDTYARLGVPLPQGV